HEHALNTSKLSSLALRVSFGTPDAFTRFRNEVHMTSKPVRENVVLDFKCAGWRSGLPILLLHGSTDSRRSYHPVVAQLPDWCTAIAVSQGGHGDSERPEDGYLPADLASDIVHLMDTLSIQKAVVVGHSLGATVAQRFAIDYPDRTLGLVLV